MRSLDPSDVFPAGVAGIVTRTIDLRTGIRVRVAESGPADGAPFVMLHGWGASLYMYHDALSLLPRQGIRAIAVDLRGYGLSDRPRARGEYSLDHYLDDLDALLSSLGYKHVALMGQSMGGGIALHYALRHPARVKSLVLINPVGLVPIGWVRVMRLIPRQLMESLGARMVPRWLTGFILRHLAYGDASLVTEHDVDENWAPTRIPGFVYAVRAGIAEFDWSPISAEQAASLTVPTLVVLGTKDRVIIGARRAAERLNGVKVVSFEGGHCVHEEHPREVYGAIEKWLGEE